jgi:hypothetical protein
VKQFRQNCLGGHQGQAELEKCIRTNPVPSMLALMVLASSGDAAVARAKQTTAKPVLSISNKKNRM